MRADAAVARQGLRAAGGAPGASRFPESVPAADEQELRRARSQRDLPRR
jgi:hypothetical protein